MVSQAQDAPVLLVGTKCKDCRGKGVDPLSVNEKRGTSRSCRSCQGRGFTIGRLGRSDLSSMLRQLGVKFHGG